MTTSEREFRIDCETCGMPTPHRRLGGTPEQDDEGGTFQRTECCKCGAHARLYDNSEDVRENEN